MQYRVLSVAVTAAALMVGAIAQAADKPADATKPDAAATQPKSAAPKSATGSSKASAPAKDQAKPAQKDVKPKVVDINTASRDELKTLPGITDADADKIIAARPFLSKAHLVTRGVISEAQYFGLKGRIKASQKSGDPTKSAK